MEFSQEITIVSTFPFPINEEKPGIIPRYYPIPAAKENDIELLYVGSGIMYVDLIDRKEKLQVDVSAVQIAQSIVRDFVSCQLAYDEDSAPGLFILNGKFTKDEVKKQFAKEIERARQKQNNWFRKLVFLADDDWNKYHQHRLISSLQRTAAKILKLEREWMIEATPPKSCPACGTKLPNDAVAICASCGCVIDPEKAKQFKFAVKA